MWANTMKRKNPTETESNTEGRPLGIESADQLHCNNAGTSEASSNMLSKKSQQENSNYAVTQHLVNQVYVPFGRRLELWQDLKKFKASHKPTEEL
ncbi:hypothetical protein Tco_0074745 [Tanacetum coccineum]